jgi:hypothetical protein
MTVMDSHGQVVGQARASSDLGDVVVVRINQASPNATYFVKVQAATNDVFGIGGYGVSLTFDALNQVSASTLDTVLRGPYEALNPSDLNAILLNQGQLLFNNGGDNLATAPGFKANTRFETVGSLSAPSSANLYRIQPPNVPSGQSLVLTATVRSIAPNGAAPRVALLDSDQNVIRAQVLANGNGVYTVQAVGVNVKNGGNYFLRVSANGSPAGVGNYALEASFGTTGANLTTFAGGALGASAPEQSYNFYVAESQIFQFLLTVASTPTATGSSVNATILDANGAVAYALNGYAGETTSNNAVFLTPGAYTLRFSASGPNGAAPPALTYALAGESISDPIGPTLSDPTLSPVYTTPGDPTIFTYPGGAVSPVPFLIVPFAAKQPA